MGTRTIGTIIGVVSILAVGHGLYTYAGLTKGTDPDMTTKVELGVGGTCLIVGVIMFFSK